MLTLVLGSSPQIPKQAGVPAPLAPGERTRAGDWAPAPVATPALFCHHAGPPDGTVRGRVPHVVSLWSGLALLG